MKLRVRKFQFLIRKEVKRLLTNSDNEIVQLLEEKILKRGNSNSTRLIWLIFCFICLGVCCYQTADRILYYRSRPSRVDTEFASTEEVQAPEILAFGLDTPALKQYWDQLVKLLGTYECGFGVKDVLFQGANVSNYTELWMQSNLTAQTEYIGARKFEKVVQKLLLKDGEITLNNADRLQLEEKNMAFGSTLIMKMAVPLSPSITFEARFRTNGSCTGPRLTGAIFMKTLPYQYAMIIGKGITTRITFSIRMFKFLPLTKPYCQPDERVSIKCYEDCIAEKESSLPCRLPFMSKNSKQIDCTLVKNKTLVTEVYKKSFFIATRTSAVSDCPCMRSCENTAYSLSSEFLLEPVDTITVLMRQTEDTFVRIREEYVYDAISLLADLGGNLGFSLGLCTLSLIQTLQIMSRQFWEKMKVKSKRIRRVNKLIKHVYVRDFSNDVAISNMSWKLRTLQIIISVVSITVAGYVTRERFNLYSAEPIMTLVKATQNDSIKFPRMIACGDGLQFAELRDAVVKDGEDKCKIHLLDLMDSEEKPSLSKIWKSKVLTLETIVTPNMKETMDTVDITSEKIDTHAGTCLEFDIESHKYVGSQSMAFVSLEEGDGSCNENAIQIYFRSPEDRIHKIIKTRRNIAQVTFGLVGFRFFKKILVNTKRNPCTDIETFNKCQNECFERQFQKSVKCRLPFMENTAMRNCSTSDEAKRALATFVEISLTVECNCQPACDESLFATAVNFQTVAELFFTVLFVQAGSNLFEEFEQAFKYPFESLLCEIINIFGLMLGLSLLAFPKLFYVLRSVLLTSF